MTLPKDWDKMSIHALYDEFGKQRERDRESGPSSEPNPPQFGWINPPGWATYPPPLPEYVVEGLIPRRQVTLFTGHGAAGKSTVALNLCVATALGRPWLNYAVSEGTSFFIDAEDEEGVIYQRTLANTVNYGCTLKDLDNLNILSLAGKDPVMATADRSGRIIPTQLFNWILQQAEDLKPAQIVVASSANVFTGSELDRAQVTGFINLLHGLALAANGSVILIAHPSLTGMNSGSGISGNTAWHNAVRAQMYLKGVANGDDEDNSDLRKLEFLKNQYGKIAASLTLKWRDGMFLPEGILSDYEKAALDAKAEEIFETLLRRFACSGRHLSHKPRANNYAPHTFAHEAEAKTTSLRKKDLEAAMQRLFQKLKIKVEPYGPKSDRTEHIVIM